MEKWDNRMDEAHQKVYENLPECPICYNKIYEIDKATLKCGHQMHKICLAKWSGNPKNEIDRNKTCPMCRGPLELKYVEGMIRRKKNEEDMTGGKQRKKHKSKKYKRRKRQTKKRTKR